MKNQVISDLSQAPLPDMLENLGVAVANSQFAMDKNAITIAKMLGDRDNYGVQFSGEEEKRSLLELGFQPTFYHISEATIDIRISLSMSQASETKLSASVSASGGAGFVMFAASLSASYTNKYSYDSKASSSLTARFVAVPPPKIFSSILSMRHGLEQENTENENQ